MRHDTLVAGDYCPPGRVRFRRLLWLPVAAGCLAGAAVFVATLLDDVAVANRTRYAGNLNLVMEPIALELPADVPLAEILVVPGDRVVAGQALATLDRAEIRHRLDALERAILIDVAARTCLQAGAPAEDDMPVDGLDDETRAGLAAALETCSLQLEVDALETDRLEDSRQTLAADIALLEASRTILMDRPAAGTDEKMDMAAKAITLTAELNRLKGRRDELDAARREAETRRKTRQLGRIEALTTRIAEAHAEQARLTRYFDDPNLDVARSGQVLRVRRIPTGTVLHQARPILEIRPGDDPSYRVHFDAPSEEIRTFDAGDDVHVDLMGQAGAPLPLRGRIDGLEQSPSGTTLRVSVALDHESVTRLREHPVAFSLETRNSAVAVSVRRSDTTLSNGVRGVVTDLAEDLSTGWAALLDIPADPADAGTAGTDMAQARTGLQTQDYVRTP